MPLQPLIAPPKKQGSAFFKTAPKREEMHIPNYTGDITTMSRRIRVLEEKNIGVRNKIELIEHNMLNRNKTLSTEIKAMDSEIMELKKEIHELKDRMLMLIKELQETAKKAEVMTLKKYLDLWEPIRFVTRNEVKDIVRETLGK